MSLRIDLAEVESAIASLQQGLSAGEAEQLYSEIIGSFTRSEGAQADALRELQSAEKRLASSANQLLSEFAESVRFAAAEMHQLDERARQQMILEFNGVL